MLLARALFVSSSHIIMELQCGINPSKATMADNKSVFSSEYAPSIEDSENEATLTEGEV